MKRMASASLPDLPRERLEVFGAAALSDDELLAILIGFGTKGHPVAKVALKVREIIDRRNGGLSFEELAAVPGIGRAKGTLILAALEFARRRIRPEGHKICEPKDIIPLVQHLADRQQEHFVCISLNGAHEVIKTRIVTIGLVNAAHVHPREVFCDVISDRAVAVVVAHNHPSGGFEPSKEDIEITKRLRAAGALLGITLLDHIIFSRRGFYSFQENGHLASSHPTKISLSQ